MSEAVNELVNTIDIPEENVPTFELKDITEGTDPYDALIPVEQKPLEALTIPTLSKEQIQTVIAQLAEAPDFFDHFWKLPFIDYDFIYNNELEEYIEGTEKDKYLKWKLKKRIADKKKSRCT